MRDTDTNPTGRSGTRAPEPDGTAGSPPTAVRTEGLWKIYEQEPAPVEAVRDLSLEVRAGDFVAMAGPSGSGKTTLLNLLGGLTAPTRGRVWVAAISRL